MSGGPGAAPSRGSAVLLAAAALLLVLAGSWPPESEPWSRAACQILVAISLVVTAAREAGSGPPAWLAILLPLPVVSILFASCRARAVDETVAALVLVGAALLGRSLGGEARARRVLLALLVGLGVLAALRAAGQHHVLFPGAALSIRMADPEESGELLGRLLSGRPSGPFTLPAALGGFLALGLPAAAAAVMRPGRAAFRLAAAAALLAEGYALFLSRSLGALAAGCAGLLLLLPVMAPRKVRSAALLLVCAAVLVGGFFLFARRAEILQAPGSDPLSLRAGNWSAAARMIADHPILGTGPGSFGTFYPRYLRPGMNETRYAHNSYLQLVAGWGLWAVLPLIIFLGAMVRATRRALELRAPGIVALAGGWTFLLHNLADFTAYLPGVAIPAALLLGIGFGAVSPPPAPGAPRIGRRRAAGVLAALLFGALLAWHGVASARCAISLEEARQAALQGEVDRAAGEARRAVRARPDHPDPRQFLAELVLTERMSDGRLRAEGEAAAERAVALEPESAILHYTRALYYRAAGETGAATREQYAAHLLHPRKSLYRPEPSPAGDGAP